MAIPKVPQNQIAALPLIDFNTSAAGGDVIILGNSITRFWSATVLGMPGNFVNIAGGASELRSNVLDVTGCSRFVLLVTATIGIGGYAGQTIEPHIQFQNSAGLSEVNTSAATTPNSTRRRAQNLVLPDRATPWSGLFSCTWNDTGIVLAGGAGNGLATVGARCMVVLKRGVALNVNESYSCELWGASQ